MGVYYTYEMLKEFDIFSFIDFTTFTSYEQAMFTLVFNILFLVFLIFFGSVVYKTICRIVSYLF